MRLWSVHPSYLDPKGLVALWREGLLAQNVLLGNTRGYKNHPQLIRFRDTGNPVGAIATYLSQVADEADRRGYQFDRSKLARKSLRRQIPVARGQVDYEFSHLLKKLKARAPNLYREYRHVTRIKLHPLFVRTRGGIENWEIV